MRTIHKVVIAEELSAYGLHRLRVPEDSIILSVGLQDGRLMLWYVCDNEDLVDSNWTCFVGWTGRELPEAIVQGQFKFLGSFQSEVTGLVHHVFGVVSPAVSKQGKK